jgi:hypothetical protein
MKLHHQLEQLRQKVPIVLQKSFLAGDGNFLEPLMRFARGDVRVHIGSHKNDQGPPYPSYRALQRRRRLKIARHRGQRRDPAD